MFYSGFREFVHFPICELYLILSYPLSLYTKGYSRHFQGRIKGKSRETRKLEVNINKTFNGIK